MASDLYSWISKLSASVTGWILSVHRSILSITCGLSKDQPVPDDQSETSTLIYTQEPFDTFKERVSLVFQEAFNTLDANLTIDRMRGGSSNRITCVSVARDETKSVVEHFVIRVPRFLGDEVDGIAPLQILRQQSTIPIPEIVQFDPTTSNPLGKPYVIMKRLSGSPLWSSYYEMTHESKCVIAQSLGKVFAEMHSITSTVAGKITLSAFPEVSSRGSLMIQPLDKLESDTMVPYKVGPASQNTFDTLCGIIDRQKEILMTSGPDDEVELGLFEEWQKIASEMNDLGIFDQDGYCLCHLDFEARNIMSQQQAITGILDWDTALFAPLFVSCTPPMWIWDKSEDEEEDGRLAGEVPPTPELCQIKQLFEEAAGPTYLRYAYLPQFRLARTLFRFIIDGITSNEDFDRSDHLQNEWNEVRGTLELVRNGEEFDGLGDQQ